MEAVSLSIGLESELGEECEVSIDSQGKWEVPNDELSNDDRESDEGVDQFS